MYILYCTANTSQNNMRRKNDIPLYSLVVSVEDIKQRYNLLLATDNVSANTCMHLPNVEKSSVNLDPIQAVICSRAKKTVVIPRPSKPQYRRQKEMSKLTHGVITKLAFVMHCSAEIKVKQAHCRNSHRALGKLEGPDGGCEGPEANQRHGCRATELTGLCHTFTHHFTVALSISYCYYMEGLRPGTGIRQFCTCFFRASIQCLHIPYRSRPEPSPEPQRHHISSSYLLSHY